MTRIEDFCKLMDEYTQYLEGVAASESDKLDAFVSGELEKIEQAIATQQVVEKQMQVFEKKREKLLASENLQGQTFAQIIATLAPPHKENMQKSLVRMRDAAEKAKHYNQKSLDYVKTRMHLYDIAENAETGYTQDKKSKAVEQPSLFSKKI